MIEDEAGWQEVARYVHLNPFSQAHGDWGRDAALWLGRKRGRYTLPELGELAGGLDYSAVGKAVSRFERRRTQDTRLRSELAAVENQLSKGPA